MKRRLYRDLGTTVGLRDLSEALQYRESSQIVVPPPVEGVALPTYELHVHPGYYYSVNDDPGHRAVWVDHSSLNASTSFPNESAVIATPQSQDARSTKKSWVWWFAHEVKVDTSWDYLRQGAWGTTAPEAHFSSHDVGNFGSGGIGWGWGQPGSAYQVDHNKNASGIGGLYTRLLMEEGLSEFYIPIQAPLVKGVWHSVLSEVVMGLRDGSVLSGLGHPNNGYGRLRVWLDGNPTPVTNRDQVNTLQRAQGQDGNWYTQTLAGCYTCGFYSKQTSDTNFTACILSSTAVRIGRTLQECLDDRPVLTGARVAAIRDSRFSAPFGPSFYNTLSGANARTTATFLLPAGVS